jgi:hypothetical protein
MARTDAEPVVAVSHQIRANWTAVLPKKKASKRRVGGGGDGEHGAHDVGLGGGRSGAPLSTGKAHALADEGILGFLELRIGAEQAREVRRDLKTVLDVLRYEEDAGAADDQVRYRLAIAFFPLAE